jgi:hypothetical protein
VQQKWVFPQQLLKTQQKQQHRQQQGMLCQQMLIRVKGQGGKLQYSRSWPLQQPLPWLVLQSLQSYWQQQQQQHCQAQAMQLLMQQNLCKHSSSSSQSHPAALLKLQHQQ